MGLSVVPSSASLARIFRQAGVARVEPRKKPRSAWRRFAYLAPNACWQPDGTYKIDIAHAFRHVLVVSDGDQTGGTITVTDLAGEILAAPTRPAPGTRYVGNGQPRGRRPTSPEVSPKS